MKIFRKIRFQLLKKGKTTEYLKYAFGEILLVVLGILIALQINNWNETKKANSILKDYLVKIKSHTKEDLRQLDTITIGRKQIADVCKKARVAMLTNTEEKNIYTMMISGTAFADFFFKPKTDGYESLKNSSSFVKINNTVLDSLLIQYHGMIENIAENEKSYNDYILTQEAHISKEFDRSLILASAFMPQDSLAQLAISQSEYIETYKAYTSLAPFKNVVSLAAFQFDIMIDQYEQLQHTGKNIIKEIDMLTSKTFNN
ncbi:DUF6090 family protein [Jejuia pallidilutea]|uniref:Uncharacterized protein n=1 Tax=Jejuia pallidilutea TaxID=504487 RepID=A0A090WDR8_9FLAO|nr:DUF6090 family protein [Jejuia pallidilutea]GAL65682.1 hypothetical protein JCM19301_3367 [Jejuia pallidilutea]GAL72420.1 hypothetical protein JCM19302_1182 [Jejuia pallidilutea]GAL88645.1 hypothetical protein JCM19538_3158 [Jejuia pallidilutea]